MPRLLAKRPDRSRLQTVIAGHVHERVDLYCAHYGITESRFFETAALEKLDGSGDAKSLARQVKALNEQLEIMSEHNNLFVQMWLRHTQLFTKEEQQAARARAQAEYDRFERKMQTNLTKGGAFLSEFRRQLRATAAVSAPAATAAVESTRADAPDNSEPRVAGRRG